MAGRSARCAALALLLAAAPVAVAARDGTAGKADAQGWGSSVEVKPARPGPDPAKRAVAPPAAARGDAAARGARASAAAQPAAAGAGRRARAVLGHAITGDEAHTLVAFDVAGPITVAARSLGEPYRVIIDLPEAEFRLPAGAGGSGQGLVAAFRFGLIEAGKSRIVLDLAGPARIERAEVAASPATGARRLEVELRRITPAEHRAILLADAAGALKPAVPVPAPAPEAKPKPRSGLRPVVVVDPGHGGVDPGTQGTRSVEKSLVLDVALALRQALVATRRYEVVMTRASDVFVSLDERLRLARHHQAELFVSLHADSLPGREQAKAVRGATVYTLAEEASDDNARRVAEQENAVDLLAGLPLATVGDDQVRTILIDLMRRESMIFSNEFRQLLLAEMRPRVLLARDPQRSAPFKVLRHHGTAAVLVELGFMSNAQDEEQMLAADWQAKVAKAIAAAVDAYFAARGGGRP